MFREKPFRIFRVEPAHPRAFCRFIDGGPEGLAHLRRHHARKGFFFAVQNRGSLQHHLRARGKGHIPVA